MIFARCLSLLSVAGLGGCAEPAASTEASHIPQRLEVATGALTFAEVSARGPGCPSGTWETRIAPEGDVFTTNFSAYELDMSPETSTLSTSCALSMKLRSAPGTQLSVLTVSYGGYAFLEPGVRGRHSVRYGFSGTGANAGHSQTELTGPHDEEFVITDEVGRDKQKWSACAAEHTLTASTELRLFNGKPKGSGYFNLSAVDGALSLGFRVATRPCPTPRVKSTR